MLLFKPALLALLALVAAQNLERADQDLDTREDAEAADASRPWSIPARIIKGQFNPNCGIAYKSCGRVGRLTYCAPMRATCCRPVRTVHTYCPFGYKCGVGMRCYPKLGRPGPRLDDAADEA